MTGEGVSAVVEHLTSQVATLTSDHEPEDIDCITVASEIDVTTLLSIERDGGQRSPLDAEPLIRAFLFRHLRGIEMNSRLREHLSNNSNDAEALGFEQNNIPDRCTLGRWWKDYFSDTLRSAIKSSADAVERTLREQGIPLDSESFATEQSSGTSSRTRKRTRDKKAKEVLKKLREYVYPELELKRKGPVKYDDSAFFDLMTHMCIHKSFAHDGSESFEDYLEEVRGDQGGENEDERISPSGDTLLYHLKKFSHDELKEICDTITEVLVNLAKRMDEFDGRVDVAIDENVSPFYGSLSTPMVSAVKKTAGTSYGYEFLTLCIVGNTGERFQLGFIPVTSREEKRQAVDDLIDKAQEHFDINHLYADRGFYDTILVDKIEKRDLWYVIRGQKGKKEADDLYEGLNEDQDVDFDLGATLERKKAPPYASVNVNLVIGPAISDDDKYIMLITNKPVTQESAEQMVENYHDRWGIETSYRVMGDFHPKTCSTDFTVRYFYYMFSMAMYNVFILTNALLEETLDMEPDATNFITAKRLQTMWRQLHGPILV